MERFIFEKDFFDLDTDNQANNEMDAKTDIETSAEENVITTSDILKLKILWSHLVYLYRVTRKLAILNDSFETNFEEFQDLFRVFRDFVINYEDYSEQSRKEFIDIFRKSFIEAIKHLKQTILSIGG